MQRDCKIRQGIRSRDWGGGFDPEIRGGGIRWVWLCLTGDPRPPRGSGPQREPITPIRNGARERLAPGAGPAPGQDATLSKGGQEGDWPPIGSGSDLGSIGPDPPVGGAKKVPSPGFEPGSVG